MLCVCVCVISVHITMYVTEQECVHVNVCVTVGGWDDAQLSTRETPSPPSSVV